MHIYVVSDDKNVILSLYFLSPLLILLKLEI